jgi:Arc/MetJ family transcription regulator
MVWFIGRIETQLDCPHNVHFCLSCIMKLTIALDDSLLTKAKAVSKIKDNNKVIEKALRLYIKTIENQSELQNLFAKINIDEDTVS